MIFMFKGGWFSGSSCFFFRGEDLKNELHGNLTKPTHPPQCHLEPLEIAGLIKLGDDNGLHNPAYFLWETWLDPLDFHVKSVESKKKNTLGALWKRAFYPINTWYKVYSGLIISIPRGLPTIFPMEKTPPLPDSTPWVQPEPARQASPNLQTFRRWKSSWPTSTEEIM